MEEKIKEIVSKYTKIPVSQIDAQTVIDRSAVASSILLHRMYGALSNEGIIVENYWDVKNFGNLLQRINGKEHIIIPAEAVSVHAIPNANTNNSGASTGIDIEEISSMPAVNDFREDRFYTMNFTPEEIAYCILQPNARASFAGLFAAKEAIVKADINYKNKPFNTIFIDHLPNGKPVHESWQLSISHTGELAIAVAINISSAGPALHSSLSGIPSPLNSNKSSLSTWLSVAAILSSLLALLLLLSRQ